MDVGEAEVAALELEGELLVVEAEQVQQGRVQVVDVGLVLDAVEAEFVGLAVGDAGADAAAGEPHGEGVDVVVAAGLVAVFAHRRAAEFAAPDDQGLLEQAAGLEVADEAGAGLVNLVHDLRKIVLEGLALAAMAVPVGVVELDEAHAALDQAAGEQAVAGERGLAGVDAVQVEGRLGFAADVDELRRARLHAVGHLVGLDARLDLGVAGGDEALQVELAHGAEDALLAGGVDAGRRAQVEDGLALAAQRHALVGGGQEAAAPVDRAAARAARTALQDDKPRQVGRLAADAVGDPGAHRRPAELAAAGVHEQLGGRVVEQRGLAGGHDAQVVDHAGGVRQQVADPGAALAVAPKRAAGAEQLDAVAAAHEGEALALDVALRDRLAAELLQLRFVVEQLELGGPAGHEQENDVPGLGRDLPAAQHARPRGGRRGRMQPFLRHQRRQGDAAQAQAAPAEKVPARGVLQGGRGGRKHGCIYDARAGHVSPAQIPAWQKVRFSGNALQEGLPLPFSAWPPFPPPTATGSINCPACRGAPGSPWRSCWRSRR